jgi:cyanate lyase
MSNETNIVTKEPSLNNMDVKLKSVIIDDEIYYQISNNDVMRPFFMSIVSDSNHWMFISSNGGLTAGRKNSEYALFPYYTDDKITESADITGNKSIFKVSKDSQDFMWEPLAVRSLGSYSTTQNLYKNKYGNKIIFEEINHDLELIFRYQWSSSNTFGFIKKSKLINTSDSAVKVSLLDGIQNIMPASIGSDEQNQSSNLVDAYKRNELEEKTGLGIFALSAILVDKAEASEALKANVVWSLGLDNPKYLLSSIQLNNFRLGKSINQEVDVKAEKGAYFLNSDIILEKESSKEWMIIANVNQNHSSIAKLSRQIREELSLIDIVNDDINIGTKRLVELNSASDAIQITSDNLKDTRHFANTLFNIMRGGIFDNNYQIEKWDFKNYLEQANTKVAFTHEEIIEKLPEKFSLSDLQKIAYNNEDKNFRRLCLEYMPLKFSRRHGDPSRPWNKFSINTRNEIDGSKILDYEGNWRDIFQNWEALAHSYPEFIESMIHKFLNATTFDGYNPYRVTKGGFDWETIEPDDPWSYIGYWGDHQIIYLLKFLEFINNHKPGRLESFFTKNLFVYANVPYKIKSYQELLKNPKDTIIFDQQLDSKIREERSTLGADGALLRDEHRFIIKANFIEKILATSLAKLSNFIPEGGIWMNTQRPEWNDANNALVGNGVSMVTLYYLNRFFNFFEELLKSSTTQEVEVSNEIIQFFDKVLDTFEKNKGLLSSSISNSNKKIILDALGEAGSEFRLQIYNHAFSGRKTTLSFDKLKRFVSLSKSYLEHSIKANKRSDNLYHAYNLMTVNNDNTISISYLSEMLEGQVAVLSSGYLNGKETLNVLNALKESKLFRKDQYSYLLYPFKELKGFLDRNTISEDAVLSSKLFQEMLKDNNVQIIEKDVNGAYHFNGNFKNANDVTEALEKLSGTKYNDLLDSDTPKILQTFEDVFNHKAFTGRSGTFYGYEGLGSIYWHMVSKLLLAVQESCLQAISDGEDEIMIGHLLEHFYEINEGIGVHKSPELYGAFPTDPYSHTPGGKGAQQPGMTGQVKEDVITRFGELGVFVKHGKLYFNPCLLRKEEFLSKETSFEYLSLLRGAQSITIPSNSLAFTYCQVPIIYHISDKDHIEIIFKDGTSSKIDALVIDLKTSEKIFKRTGDIVQINAYINSTYLK